MHTPSLAGYLECLGRGDWQGVAELMLASAALKRADAGARFLFCPDNTIHQAFPLVEPRSPLPWLHIAEVVAQEAAQRGFRRLGLIGTRWLVESDVYPGKLASLGLQYLRPEVAERDEINRIILRELVYGVVSTTATLPGRGRVYGAGRLPDRRRRLVLRAQPAQYKVHREP